MADEKITYSIAPTGANETADAFDRIAASMERSAQNQEQLTAAQRRSGDVERIQVYEQEAAAIDQMSVSLEKSSAAQSVFNKASENTNSNLGPLKTKAGEVGSTISAMSAAFSGFGPAAQIFNNSIGRAFQLLSPLLGVLGGAGGVGLAAGGVIAAVTALAGAFSESSKNADKFTESTKAGKAALEDLKASIDGIGTSLAASTAAYRQDKKFKEESASVDEYELRIMQDRQRIQYEDLIQRRLAQAQKEENEKRNYELIGQLQDQLDLIKKAKEELPGLEAGLHKAIQTADYEQLKAQQLASLNRQVELQGGEPETPSAAPKKPKFDSFAASQQVEETLRKIDKMQLDYWLKEQKDKDDLRWQDTKASLDAEWQKRDEATKTFEQKMKQDEDLFRARERGFRREVAARHAANAAIMANTAIVAGGASKLVTQLVEGQKLQGAAILKMIGESMIAEGTRATFTGIIQLATFQPQGAVTLATGLAEIAAGIGLAGAGAGGGAAPANAGSVSTTPPEQNAPLSDNSQQQGTVQPQVVYIEFTSLTGPSPEDGLRVRQALMQANNVYGSQV